MIFYFDLSVFFFLKFWLFSFFV